MNIRKITKTDRKEYETLRNIWMRAFGDEADEIDSLYDKLNASGYIIEEDSEIRSCLTVYKSGSYNGSAVNTIYAVCTLPEFQGQGYASQLVKYVKDEIESNDGVAITCPADENLVAFYAKLGFTTNLMAMTQTISPDEEVIAVSVKPINHKQYGKYREAFLKDYSHIVPSDELLEQVQSFSISGNGMLLINNGDAICILDRGTEDEMFLSELLVNPLLQERSSEIINEIAAGLAGLFETKRVTFHTTAKGNYVQAMSGNVELENVYYGFPME